jgi:hypothetical protein
MREAYPSDLTDDRWAFIEPSSPSIRVGRPARGPDAGGPRHDPRPGPIRMTIGRDFAGAAGGGTGFA